MSMRDAKIKDGRVVLTEAQFKRQVIRTAKAAGWLVSEMVDGEHNKRQQGDAGAPDLTLCHPERNLFLMVELKTDDGRLSKEQERWIDAIEDAGVDVEIWRPAYWHSIEALLAERHTQSR